MCIWDRERQYICEIKRNHVRKLYKASLHTKTFYITWIWAACFFSHFIIIFVYNLFDQQENVLHESRYAFFIRAHNHSNWKDKKKKEKNVHTHNTCSYTTHWLDTKQNCELILYQYLYSEVYKFLVSFFSFLFHFSSSFNN